MSWLSTPCLGVGVRGWCVFVSVCASLCARQRQNRQREQVYKGVRTPHISFCSRYVPPPNPHPAPPYTGEQRAPRCLTKCFKTETHTQTYIYINTHARTSRRQPLELDLHCASSCLTSDYSSPHGTSPLLGGRWGCFVGENEVQEGRKSTACSIV